MITSPAVARQEKSASNPAALATLPPARRSQAQKLDAVKAPQAPLPNVLGALLHFELQERFAILTKIARLGQRANHAGNLEAVVHSLEGADKTLDSLWQVVAEHLEGGAIE